MELDYKKCVEILKWHSVYSELNGTEARVLMYMVTSANYKTGLFIGSQMELAEALSTSKQSVNKAIAELKKNEAILETKAGTGRMPATYRIRTAEDLNTLFVKEEKNEEYETWHAEKYRLFDEMEGRYYAVTDGCTECDGETNLCELCRLKTEKFKEREEYRRMLLWMADNPEPPSKVKMIRGKVCAKL